MTWKDMEGKWLAAETNASWTTAIKHKSHIYVVRFISERPSAQGLRPTLSIIHIILGGRKKFINEIEIGSISNYKLMEPDRGDLHMALKAVFDEGVR
jgi:hypothetical protein